jgi:hypothetical protein
MMASKVNEGASGSKGAKKEDVTLSMTKKFRDFKAVVEKSRMRGHLGD